MSENIPSSRKCKLDDYQHIFNAKYGELELKQRKAAESAGRAFARGAYARNAQR